VVVAVADSLGTRNMMSAELPAAAVFGVTSTCALAASGAAMASSAPAAIEAVMRVFFFMSFLGS